jgi:hypothetical protein
VALADVVSLTRIERRQRVAVWVGQSELDLPRHSPPSDYVEDKKRHDQTEHKH